MVQGKFRKKKFEIREKEQYIAGSIKPTNEQHNKQENFPQYIINCEKVAISFDYFLMLANLKFQYYCLVTRLGAQAHDTLWILVN